MKRILCALLGHKNITYLTVQWGTPGVVIGAACLRCHDCAVGDTTVGHLIPTKGDA